MRKRKINNIFDPLPFNLLLTKTIKYTLKRFFALLLLFFLAVGSLFGQYKRPTLLNDPDYDVGKPLSFGFSIGVNVMDFDAKNRTAQFNADGTKYFAEVTHITAGLNVNAIGDLRVTPEVHLRFLPGYSFGQRDVDFFRVDPDSSVSLATTMKMESNFIDLPVGIKFLSERNSNVRPYLYMGTDVRIDLAAYKRLKVEKGVLLRLKKFDYYYEIGFGIDFFLQYFKFSAEIKWSAGLLNMLSNDYVDEGKIYHDALESLRSKLLIVSFHFE